MHEVTFKSHQAYWQFHHSVLWKNRFIRTQDQIEFLNTVLSTTRVELIAPGTEVYRAQRGCRYELKDIGPSIQEELPCPHPRDRMKPLRDRAPDGRANARGMPCLYVATHQPTAVAEMRSWIGAYISVALLKTSRELRIVDCTSDHPRYIYFGEPDPIERERAVWKDIDYAFSTPVTLEDDTADYAPTQVLAEAFRQHGYDGLAYRSSVGEGRNLALFDIESASVINCSLCKISSVKIAYETTEFEYSS